MHVSCSSALKLCFFCAKLLLRFQLSHSWGPLPNSDCSQTEHQRWDEHRIEASDVGENNGAIGPVKYLVSISCPPAPHYLQLYWHLNPNSPAWPNDFSTWFTILVNWSISLLFPQAGDLGFIIDCFFSHYNQLMCTSDTTITLSLHNHPCLNSH